MSRERCASALDQLTMGECVPGRPVATVNTATGFQGWLCLAITTLEYVDNIVIIVIKCNTHP